MQKPTLVVRGSALGITLAVSLGVGLLSAEAVRGKKPVVPARKKVASGALTGAQIYQKRCASCHGAKGEGTKAYQKPLAGTQTAGDLAGFISKSMPPGPASQFCTGPDAQKVARYIYDAFYSPIAQARNKPARVELSRLTVGQYRNALADLVGSFRPKAAPVPAERGLRGEYFKSRERRQNERILERVDGQIQFDYAQATAIPEQTDPYQFAMRWSGAVVAPDTGEYEFIVKTEQGNRLWVNDLDKPLIDAGVKSGNETEHRATLFLVGGRTYPVRLEFTKEITGVNNQERLRAQPPAKASLSLEWRRPKQAQEVIPQRCLVPAAAPETYVVSTSFPPDDKSVGYERGNSVSKEWDMATTEAALDTATYIVGHLRELTGADEKAADRAAKVQAFCKQFVTRALRRPLAPEVEQFYVTRHFPEGADLETAVKRVVLLTLKSSRFLFRELGEGDQYDIAAKLSFGLWDSLPDDELLRAAGAGELGTREQVVKQAERMLADPRTKAKVHHFFMSWLHVEQVPELAKDSKQYPEFNDKVSLDLRTSLELFIDETVWSERSDFRELMLSDKVFMNGKLAKLYGAQLPEDAPFQPVSFEADQRAGLLTHPYMMASLSYLSESSPIHRGVLIARNMLGRTLQPPPVAVSPVAADLHPNLTTRQRVVMQTKPGACASCHNMINPLGFTLENFDAIGRLRMVDQGKPVDTSGSYVARNGKTIPFKGAEDLAKFMATSDEAHTAFAQRLFQYVVKQPVQAYGPQALPELRQKFAVNEFSIREQLVETVAVAAFPTTTPAPKPAP